MILHRIFTLFFVLRFIVLPGPSAAQGTVDTLPRLRHVAAPSCDIAYPVRLKPPPESSPQPDPVDSRYRIKTRQYLIPAIILGVGTTGVTIAKIRVWDDIAHSNFESLHRRRFDNYLQYAPMAAPYLLKLSGVRGRHSYGEYTLLLATSYASMGIMVNVLKYTVRRERPDGSSRNSFPSGHTATAFMGAELLRSEYWEVSPMIGVAGYSVAVTIGFMRVYNNRHWVTDVIAGAGIGILSARIGYWTLPAARTLFRGRKNRPQEPSDVRVSFVPYYDGSRFGAAFGLSF